MKIAYLIHPIRDARGLWFLHQNIRRAERIAFDLWQMGFAVVCPGKNTEDLDGGLPVDMILRGDIAIMRRCDVAVLAPGWPASVGCNGERDDCLEHGIPLLEWENAEQRKELARLACSEDD